MKKILSFFIALLLLVTSASAVDLYVDTNLVETDTPPTVIDGRTLVPVRAIFEAIGATVEWDSVTRTAIGVRNNTTVTIQIDNTTAYVNGEAKTLDVPAQLINGRTMVPARFISEAMGCDVTWYQKTQTAAVADKTKGQQIYVTATGERYHYDGSCNGGTYYEATLAEAMGRGLTPCDKCVLVNQPSTPYSGENNTAAANYRTTVIRVVDGDTIVVNYNGVEEKVRLIGVDTPESVHPDSSKNTEDGVLASEYTKERLEGKEIELEFDVQQRDVYGRLLAYVYLDGVMYNGTLLADGVANLATYPPNVKYADDFAKIVSVRNMTKELENVKIPEWLLEDTPTISQNGYDSGNFNTYDGGNQQNTTSSYVLNSGTMKFHKPDCSSVKKIEPQNYSTYDGYRDELIERGYAPCGNCHP